MIKINLLPAEVQESSESKVNPYILPAFTAVVLVSVLSLHYVGKKKISHDLKDDTASLQKELDRYEPIIRQVEGLEKEKNQLQSRKGVIQTLENERLRYPQFMDDFLKLLPNNLWLTSLTTSPTPNGAMSVKFDVIATDTYAIADLISNLESSQIFSDVLLGPISATQGSATTGQTFNFNIGTSYRPGIVTSNAPQKS